MRDRHQIESRRDDRHVGERAAERDVVRTRRVFSPGPLQMRAQNVLGQRHDLVAPLGEILHRDRDRRGGVGKRARARPLERRDDLVDRRGARDANDVRGRLGQRIDLGDLRTRGAERVEQSLLLRTALDESGERDGSAAHRDVRADRAREHVGDTRCIVGVDSSQRGGISIGPAHERRFVVALRRETAPAFAAGAIRVNRCPRFLGKRGHASNVDAHGCARRLGRDDPPPQVRRLRRRQQPDRMVGRSLRVFGAQHADPGAPRQHRWRLPRAKSGGALRIIVQRAEPAREPIVRRDDHRAGGDRRGERGLECRRHDMRLHARAPARRTTPITRRRAIGAAAYGNATSVCGRRRWIVKALRFEPAGL